MEVGKIFFMVNQIDNLSVLSDSTIKFVLSMLIPVSFCLVFRCFLANACTDSLSVYTDGT